MGSMLKMRGLALIPLILLSLVPLACSQQPAATQPTTLPVVRQWSARPFVQGEVHILAMGDWGSSANQQRVVAGTLTNNVQQTRNQFDAAILPGDNFYVKLKGINDLQWQTLFEDM